MFELMALLFAVKESHFTGIIQRKEIQCGVQWLRLFCDIRWLNNIYIWLVMKSKHDRTNENLSKTFNTWSYMCSVPAAHGIYWLQNSDNGIESPVDQGPFVPILPQLISYGSPEYRNTHPISCLYFWIGLITSNNNHLFR